MTAMAEGADMMRKGCKAILFLVPFFLVIVSYVRASEFVSCDYHAKTGRMITETECLAFSDEKNSKDVQGDAIISGRQENSSENNTP
jgi:hypothetical protein